MLKIAEQIKKIFKMSDQGSGSRRNFKLSTNNYYLLSANKSAFTLVELLVSIGLFGVIVSISMGGFIRALQTQRQIVALITANSNAALVIEQMSREIRTGFDFCQTPCPAPSTSLNFTNAKGESVVYAYSNAPGYGIITRQVGVSGPANQITAENVNIRYIEFYLQSDPNFPPRIIMVAGISPKSGQAANVSENVTNIQTTVSARSFTP